MVSEKERASDKVKTICRLITEETLTPAKMQAEETLKIAKNEADNIIVEAKKEAARIQEQCDRDVEHKLSVMKASLDMAVKQAVLFLKQEVTEHFFSKELHHMLTNELQSQSWVVKMLDAIVSSIEKEGTHSDLHVVIPKTVTREQVLQSLAKTVADRLVNAGDKGVVVGNLVGVEVKVAQENFVLSVTEEALYEIIAKYVHRELREKIFNR
jgi:vacuolar-type H+-ATPase subunit E/Vma4